MYQIQSDELCRKKNGEGPIDPPLEASCNYFFFVASRVNARFSFVVRNTRK